MNIEELEEALDELFPKGFFIDTDEQGQVIIHTHLQKDEDGELSFFEVEDEEEMDPDLQPMDEE